MGWVGLVSLVLTGCGARSIRMDGDDIGHDADADADGDTDSDCGPADENWYRIEEDATEALDLLVVMDDSRGMGEEQGNFVTAFPSLVDRLTNPGDENGDGFPDADAVASLHIGVLSTDMGTFGYPVEGCLDAENGDDGVLQNLPSPYVEGCDPTYPKFLVYDAGAPDPTLAHDIACVAYLGGEGCTFRQPFAATEKGLVLHSQPGAVNDGFLRSDALLAILFVTTSDDCSVEDPQLFGDDDALGPLSLRCYDNPEMLRPLDEIASSLLDLEPSRPNRLFVGAIAGVPADLVGAAGDDFDGMLYDARMVETVDYTAEGGGDRLVPSCDVPLVGTATPPRRIVELVRDVDGVAGGGTVQSICQSDLAGAVDVIARRIQTKVEGVCLDAALLGDGGAALGEGEHADCVVVERLPDDSSCGAGAFEIGEDGGHTICQLCQQGDGTGDFDHDFRGNDVSSCAGQSAYWQYTTTDERCGGRGHIDFSDAAEPPDGAIVDLQCAADSSAPPPGC